MGTSIALSTIDYFDKNLCASIPITLNSRNPDLVRFAKYLLIRGMEDNTKYPFIYTRDSKCQCVHLTKTNFEIRITEVKQVGVY